MNNRSRLLALIPILAAMLACTIGAPPPAANAPTLTPAAAAAGVDPTAPVPTPDVNAVMATRPLVWFAPLPPMPTHPGREFIGSEDFMSLFEPDAPWQTAASRVQVFKLYGEWVAYHATDDELRQAVTDIRRRGMALAVEAGPLDPPGDCGQAIEGFAGKEEGIRIASRIAAAGGTLNLIAMDEPYFYAHVYDGENACRWPVEKVAAEVDVFIKAMQEAIPGVIIGDTEPLTGAADAAAYMAWIKSFRELNGYDLAFLHMDVDWTRSTWPQEVESIADYGAAVGAMAVDGDLGTTWSAGDFPLQWIEVDLGEPHSIAQINLTVSQYPVGPTVHRLLARGPSGDFQLLHTFSDDTADGDVLTFTPVEVLQGIQHIRVETAQSPSWVSWREVQVVAAE